MVWLCFSPCIVCLVTWLFIDMTMSVACCKLFQVAVVYHTSWYDSREPRTFLAHRILPLSLWVHLHSVSKYPASRQSMLLTYSKSILHLLSFIKNTLIIFWLLTLSYNPNWYMKLYRHITTAHSCICNTTYIVLHEKFIIFFKDYFDYVCVVLYALTLNHSPHLKCAPLYLQDYSVCRM